MKHFTHRYLSKAMFSFGLLAMSHVALAQQAPTKPVQVEQIRESVFTPTVEIVGTIHSRNNVQLTAGVNGRLDWVAEPGTFLQEGEIVAKVDPLPLTLQQAEQQAQINRAQINLRYLERELARLKELRVTNSASQFQLDQTQSQFDLAKADLEIARLRLKQVDDQLSRTEVRAPFSGVITERFREAGGDVNRSDELVQMLDTEHLEGRVFVPVKYLPFVKGSNTITVMGDAHQIEAGIKAIIPAADMRSQSFELRVSLPASANSVWTAGQLIKANLPVQAPKRALTVHRDALILRREGTYVIVIDKDNKAHRHAVKVGQGHDDWVSITGDGLAPGDQVATRGAERLQEGQTVAITRPNA